MVFPQLMPGIVGGALLAFIISMDDLVITYFIAGVDTHDPADVHLRHAAAGHQAGGQRASP
jgi:ABC-type Fe3+ transport system permease subunit